MTTLYTHPEYRQNQEDWILARDLYEGDHNTLVSKYLWYHAIEQIANDPQSSKLRTLREQRTRYLNISEILISIWQSIFFREPVRPNKEFKALLDEHDGEENIDGKGTSLDSFAKNHVLVSALNFGKTIIVVDSFPIQPRNLAEQRTLGIRPYMELISPLDAPDWSEETGDPARLGNFNFFRYQFCGVMPRSRPDQEPKARRYSYALIQNGNSYEAQVNYVDVDANFQAVKEHWDVEKNTEAWQDGGTFPGPAEVGSIPVVVIGGESWTYDANQESLRFFNLRSTKDNILLQQGYQDKYLKGISPDEAGKYAKAFNEYAYKVLPENGDAFAIEPVSVASYESAEQEAIRNAFKVGTNKLHSLPSDSKESPGAEAQAKDSELTYALVQSTITEVENGLNRAVKYYGEFAGKKDFQGRVELCKNVTPESFSEFVTIHSVFRDLLSKVPGYDQETARKAIKRARFDSEKEAELLKAIDSVDITKALEAEKEAEKDQIGEAFGGR